MNQERINEIERFAEEFFKKLDEAHSNYENNSIKKSNENTTEDKSEKIRSKKKLVVPLYKLV